MLASACVSSIISIFASLGATPAWAQAAAPSATAGAQGPGMLMNLVPILFMLGVFYFLIMRPQMRKQKETQAFLANLKHGDSVITNGGMIGVIREIQGAVVTLEISQGVRVKFLKSQISQSAEAAQKASKPTDLRPTEVKT